MHQFLRIVCLALVLMWGFAGDVSAQWASITYSNATPNPVGPDVAVNISMRVSYDNPYSWYPASSVSVSITSDDYSFIQQQGDAPASSQTSSSFEFTHVPNRAIYYQLEAWVEYFDPEWGQYWWVGPSLRTVTVGYDDNVQPCGGDERWAIIQEYMNGGGDPSNDTDYPPVNPVPICADFKTSGSVTAGDQTFTWSMVNGGFTDGNPHNPYGRFLEFQRLKKSKELWGSGSGKFISVTSGYRCPHGNAQIRPDKGAADSRHMQGDAIDLKVSPWSKAARDFLWAKIRPAGWTFVEEWGTGPNKTMSHLHVDTR